MTCSVTGYSRTSLQEDYRVFVLWQLARAIWQHSIGMPPAIWWNNLERLHLAIDDLECRALLDWLATGRARHPPIPACTWPSHCRESSRAMTNDHATYAKLIADFARSLQTRPDRARCCSVLADAFIARRDELWPKGGPEAQPEWIADHVPGILAQLASMFSIAAIADDEESTDDFLVRMAWLPTLIKDLDQRHGRLDA